MHLLQLAKIKLHIDNVGAELELLQKESRVLDKSIAETRRDYDILVGTLKFNKSLDDEGRVATEEKKASTAQALANVEKEVESLHAREECLRNETRLVEEERERLVVEILSKVSGSDAALVVADPKSDAATPTSGARTKINFSTFREVISASVDELSELLPTAALKLFVHDRLAEYEMPPHYSSWEQRTQQRFFQARERTLKCYQNLLVIANSSGNIFPNLSKTKSQWTAFIGLLDEGLSETLTDVLKRALWSYQRQFSGSNARDMFCVNLKLGANTKPVLIPTPHDLSNKLGTVLELLFSICPSNTLGEAVSIPIDASTSAATVGGGASSVSCRNHPAIRETLESVKAAIVTATESLSRHVDAVERQWGSHWSPEMTAASSLVLMKAITSIEIGFVDKIRVQNGAFLLNMYPLMDDVCSLLRKLLENAKDAAINQSIKDFAKISDETPVAPARPLACITESSVPPTLVKVPVTSGKGDPFSLVRVLQGHAAAPKTPHQDTTPRGSVPHVQTVATAATTATTIAAAKPQVKVVEAEGPLPQPTAAIPAAVTPRVQKEADVPPAPKVLPAVTTAARNAGSAGPIGSSDVTQESTKRAEVPVPTPAVRVPSVVANVERPAPETKNAPVAPVPVAPLTFTMDNTTATATAFPAKYASTHVTPLRSSRDQQQPTGEAQTSGRALAPPGRLGTNNGVVPPSASASSATVVSGRAAAPAGRLAWGSPSKSEGTPAAAHTPGTGMSGSQHSPTPYTLPKGYSPNEDSSNAYKYPRTVFDTPTRASHPAPHDDAKPSTTTTTIHGNPPRNGSLLDRPSTQANSRAADFSKYAAAASGGLTATGAPPASAPMQGVRPTKSTVQPPATNVASFKKASAPIPDEDDDEKILERLLQRERESLERIRALKEKDEQRRKDLAAAHRKAVLAEDDSPSKILLKRQIEARRLEDESRTAERDQRIQAAAAAAASAEETSRLRELEVKLEEGQKRRQEAQVREMEVTKARRREQEEQEFRAKERAFERRNSPPPPIVSAAAGAERRTPRQEAASDASVSLPSVVPVVPLPRAVPVTEMLSSVAAPTEPTTGRPDSALRRKLALPPVTSSIDSSGTAHSPTPPAEPFSILAHRNKPSTAPTVSTPRGQSAAAAHANINPKTTALLDVYRSFCTQYGIKPNSGLLKMLPTTVGEFVTKINLDLNYIGIKGFQPLLQILKINRGLQFLNLKDNNLENNEIRALVSVLMGESGDMLTYLDLSNNPVSLAGGSAIMDLLTKQRGISTVVLRGTLIQPKILEKIAEEVEKNRNTSGPR